MSETVKFKCHISASNPEKQLGLEIRLNDQQVYNNSWVKESEIVECDLCVEDDSEYELHWIMYGKTNDHTELDADGNIVNDALIEIKDVILDDIELQHLFNEESTYKHNFNGNGNDTVEPFNNFMGCNGTVTMKFTSPFYLWLLEKM